MGDSPQPVEAQLEQYRALLGVSEAIISHRDLNELFHDLASRLDQVMPFDDLFVDLHDANHNVMRLHVLKSTDQMQAPVGHFPTDEIPTGFVWQSQEPLVISDIEQENRWPRFREEIMRKIGRASLCILPLTTARQRLGTMGIGSKRAGTFANADVNFLQRIANRVALAVENALAFRQVEELKEQLQREKVYLEEEIRTEHNFEEIVGESPELLRALKDVETVAPTDSTVLIRGETGTGKELIARAIHHLSPRKDRTFVKINCAAIPTGLLESELFGHEKGAFTGAITQKVGRFELAHRGSLFLDEVGDIPLELQPKLLRVLQDQEFERLGSTRTIRVDVRLIGATHRDLVQMVADRQFRSDLYYRLNVFPVVLPPLRQRHDDIPRLVRHFTQRFARQMGRQIESVPADVMKALQNYPWPGNVRELENFIERAVILSPGATLQAPLGELTQMPAPSGTPSDAGTLVDVERDHILRVLRETNWVLGGPHGAAERLGMNRSNLQWKMKKLGIVRPK